MANKNLSALKRVRQAEKRRLRNQDYKTRIKTCVKKVESAVASKDADAALNFLREAITVISKGSSRGIIHRNTASRKISRLTKKVNSVVKSEAA
ncbi:SSU ribosomal protein S20p [hydrothermal vent metagenome]|uniref:SSU ribosomal protein S20p n=1 Tax=hydrothermal vent metagenome TaxID=652676 RepID=A0A3B1DNX4_9ZZZZ